MIQFVWIIIKDTPVAGMKFIKISDQEERERLQKFYGWLSGPISEFTGKVQDIIIGDTKYYYHSNSNVLFVVGTDLEETSIASIFMPELEKRFFELFSEKIISSFDGKNTSAFRKIDRVLVNLVKSFSKRKLESQGRRKNLDAFEVLNLPSELQMVALVLVKLQVVTPDMVSQVSGVPPEEVERQLKEIYQRGYLYITSISDKSYFSIKPFESDEASKIITQPTPESELGEQISIVAPGEELPTMPEIKDSQIDFASSFEDTLQEKEHKFDIEQAKVIDQPEMKRKNSESAMMAPPGWSPRTKSSPSLPPDSEQLRSTAISESGPITPKFEDEYSQTEKPAKLMAEKYLPEPDEDTRMEMEQKVPDRLPPAKRDGRGIKFKKDPIAKEIDERYKMTIVIPKNGQLPSNSLRREKSFATGKIRLPNIRNKDSFLLFKLFKKDVEHLFEAILMGDMIAITSNDLEKKDKAAENIFETLQLLSPHRDLKCMKSDRFVHPKDADVVFIPKSLLKYYSWATIIDLDNKRIIGGKASDFSKNIVKKLRKVENPKEFIRELTQSASILLKVCRDINTLKIEGRKPDLYLNEVKKTFGVDVLDAGLALSERLIRMHKDCAYIAGFYIRKGLDIAVRAIVVGEPIVVIGNDPLDVYHVLESLAIFSPHKAVKAQIWTTNFAGIDISEYNLMGAQEGTDKLFKESVKVNLSSMSVGGGRRSEFLHQFLREMWHHRSKERPKFIREQMNNLMIDVRKLIAEFDTLADKKLGKAEIREMIEQYGENMGELLIDLIRRDRPDIAKRISTAI